MASTRLPNYLYRRGNIWWFRKTFTASCQTTEIRVSLKTTDLNKSRLISLRLLAYLQGQLLSNSSITSSKLLSSADTGKVVSMDVTPNITTIRNTLNYLVVQWSTEDIERWHSQGRKTPDDLDRYLETIDMLKSDAEERLRYNEGRHNAASTADFVLDELPHLKGKLSEEETLEAAKAVEHARIKSLKRTRQYFYNLEPDWLNNSPSLPEAVPLSATEPDSPLLSVMIDEYTKEKVHLCRKSRNKYRQSLALAISAFGDVPVKTITAEQGRQLRSLLPTLPKGLSTVDMLSTPLSQLIASMDCTQTITKSTANNHREQIYRLFDWMIHQGYVDDLKILSQEITVPSTSNKASRSPILDSEAKTVFESQIFSQHKGIKTKEIQHAHHFWLPLIALMAGMRPGEICQLHVHDVENVGGTWCLRIDAREEGQRLKTPNAKRRIPIHARLIELGFLRFVDDVKHRKGDKARLFPAITLIQDYYSAKPGEWYIRNLRDKLNLPRHATLYAYRHAFKDKLMTKTQSDECVAQLLGREGSPYGGQLLEDMSTMQTLVNAIDFSAITASVKVYGGLTDYHKI